MGLIAKLNAIVTAMNEILVTSPLVQAELTNLDNFLDNI